MEFLATYIELKDNAICFSCNSVLRITIEIKKRHNFAGLNKKLNYSKSITISNSTEIPGKKIFE